MKMLIGLLVILVVGLAACENSILRNATEAGIETVLEAAATPTR